MSFTVAAGLLVPALIPASFLPLSSLNISLIPASEPASFQPHSSLNTSLIPASSSLLTLIVHWCAQVHLPTEQMDTGAGESIYLTHAVQYRDAMLKSLTKQKLEDFVTGFVGFQ